MAVDMFLKIDGIEGESTDSKHKGSIEIMSFSWGLNQSGTQGKGGGGGAGKVSVQDFSIVKQLDSASPHLMEKSCQGEHISSALLTVRKAGDKPMEYLKIKLTDVLISSYQTGGASGTGVPAEQVSFSFQHVEVAVARQNPDGSIGGFKDFASCDLDRQR